MSLNNKQAVIPFITGNSDTVGLLRLLPEVLLPSTNNGEEGDGGTGTDTAGVYGDDPDAGRGGDDGVNKSNHV